MKAITEQSNLKASVRIPRERIRYRIAYIESRIEMYQKQLEILRKRLNDSTSQR